MAMTMQYALDEAGEQWPVYPLLMPASWEDAPRQLFTPLIRGVRLAVPLVAPAHILGVPGAGAFRKVFLREQRLETLGACVEQMLAAAFYNLRERPATWRMLMPKVAVCNDDYFAAEKILHPAFLCAAAELLGARRGLVVCAPARGQLYATPLEACFAEPAHACAFTWTMADVFRRAESNAISPLPIQISAQGRIIAALEIT